MGWREKDKLLFISSLKSHSYDGSSRYSYIYGGFCSKLGNSYYDCSCCLLVVRSRRGR